MRATKEFVAYVASAVVLTFGAVVAILTFQVLAMKYLYWLFTALKI